MGMQAAPTQLQAALEGRWMQAVTKPTPSPPSWKRVTTEELDTAEGGGLSSSPSIEAADPLWMLLCETGRQVGQQAYVAATATIARQPLLPMSAVSTPASGHCHLRSRTSLHGAACA